MAARAGRFDAIVVGCGAMGSAAACHLARRGLSVAAFDRFSPPHAFGSTHGGSRIIREAYHEGAAYVPMVRRAFELWDELAAGAGRRLYVRTGGLVMGGPGAEVTSGALRSARLHGLSHDVLDAAAVRRRFPLLRPDDDMTAVLEPRAGALFPEACVAAHLDQARAAGASIHVDEPVASWKAGRGGCSVSTARGEYGADRLVLAAGPWMPAVLGGLGARLGVERQTQFWFAPRGPADAFRPPTCPVFIVEPAKGRFFYGIPDLGEGPKLAVHHEGATTTPDTVDRAVAERDERPVRELVRRYVPGLDGALRRSVVCLYTNAPDGHFVIGPHPDHDEVVVLSPCSGHGFKFASVVGEIAADLVMTGRAAFDLAMFSPSRLRA